MSNPKKFLIGFLWLAAGCSVLGFVTLSREKSARSWPAPANLRANPSLVVDLHGNPLSPNMLSDPFPMPEFSLIDADERAFDSSQLRGRVHVARFFFSHCPDVCPMMSQRLVDLQKLVPDERIHFISFTVDPQRDTPEVMRQYRDETWQLDKARHLFLTGSVEQIQSLIRGFHFPVMSMEEHSQQLILIDQNGLVRGLYWTTLEQDMTQLKADLQTLLAE